ncbi:hypothetical protein [Streptomyces sp. NPDC050560]|uniref:hypothetical protein n=1 Tax=Streptomyces sp. NPDC050560 TaxID=3365630 RepID=UPI0037A3B259
MTNDQAYRAAPFELDGGLAALRGAAAGMMPQWADRRAPEACRPVPPSLINGVVVPPGSARLLDAMSEYGD